MRDRAGEHGEEGDPGEQDDDLDDFGSDRGCLVLRTERGHRGDGPVRGFPFGQLLVSRFEGAESTAPGQRHHGSHQARINQALTRKRRSRELGQLQKA